MENNCGRNLTLLSEIYSFRFTSAEMTIFFANIKQ